MQMNRGNLIEILEKKIVVLDGAMGTSIQKYNLTEKDFRGELLKDFHKDQKGNNDILSLTKPEVIKEIHKSFLKAGADIIETNSFNSTSISQEDYGTENLVYDLNYSAAKIAREVADKFTKNNPNRPRFVAGSIGPTNKTASLSLGGCKNTHHSLPKVADLINTLLLPLFNGSKNEEVIFILRSPRFILISRFPLFS